MHHRLDVITHPTNEIHLTHNLTTQVVAAIGIVSNPRETAFVVIILINQIGLVICIFGCTQFAHLIAVCILNHTTDVGLSMSKDIGIATTGKAIKDTPLTQIDDGVAADGAKEATTIHEFALSHFVTAVFLLRDTIKFSLQVNVAAVTRIIGIVITFEFIVVVLSRIVERIVHCHSSTCFLQRLTDDASLTATEDLEHIALVQVDSSATPDSGILAITASKYVECLTKHIHTLLTKKDSRVALKNLKPLLLRLVGAIETLLFAQLVGFHYIEQLFALHQGLVDVDDHIAINNTTIIAAAIDVTTRQTAVQIVICTFNR